jgi:choline dehydrogenase
MVAGAAVPGNPAKKAEAAKYDETRTNDFIEQVRVNQQNLTAELKPHCDFIVCRSGSSGSVVARRLAENPEDDVLAVMDASKCASNLGTEREVGRYRSMLSTDIWVL